MELAEVQELMDRLYGADDRERGVSAQALRIRMTMSTASATVPAGGRGSCSIGSSSVSTCLHSRLRKATGRLNTLVLRIFNYIKETVNVSQIIFDVSIGHSNIGRPYRSSTNTGRCRNAVIHVFTIL